MVKNYKEQVIVSLIIVFVLFLLSFFVLVIYSKSQKKIPNNDSLVVNFKDSNQIIIKNILPVSDQLGKKFDGDGTDLGVQGFIEFSVENISNQALTYNIYLTKKNDSIKEISEEFIKLYLTDIKDRALKGFDFNKVPTYNSLPVLDNRSGSKLLIRDTIDARTKVEYRLRAWLLDTYVISREEENFEISVKVEAI